MMPLTGWQIVIVTLASIPLLAIVSGTLIAILRIFKGGAARKGAGPDAEDAELIQEIHRGLVRMEERVEALETIVLDSERHDGKRGRP
jgi:phage shock protein B